MATDRDTAGEQQRDPWEEYRPAYRPGDYEPRREIPEQDPKCPNCGYAFDAEEWDERHLSRGPSLGESWHYTCPKCNNETLGCGT